MKTPCWPSVNDGSQARSVLECGSPLPLLDRGLDFNLPISSGRSQVHTLRSFSLLLGFILLHSTLCLRASGQTYSVDWYKIAGGGTSTSGTFTVSGTIGQHDAGAPMAGGKFSVTGGFWSLINVVQMTGMPKLIIQPIGPNSVKILWPATSSYTLQQNANVAALGGWVTAMPSQMVLAPISAPSPRPPETCSSA